MKIIAAYRQPTDITLDHSDSTGCYFATSAGMLHAPFDQSARIIDAGLLMAYMAYPTRAIAYSSHAVDIEIDGDTTLLEDALHSPSAHAAFLAELKKRKA